MKIYHNIRSFKLKAFFYQRIYPKVMKNIKYENWEEFERKK